MITRCKNGFRKNKAGECIKHSKTVRRCKNGFRKNKEGVCMKKNEMVLQVKPISTDKMSQIIVQNLPDEQTLKFKEHLKKTFSKFGKIVDDDYQIDSLNSAIFEYETLEECKLAIAQMNGKKYKNCLLHIKMST